jgi:hypothetical protein
MGEKLIEEIQRMKNRVNGLEIELRQASSELAALQLLMVQRLHADNLLSNDMRVQVEGFPFFVDCYLEGCQFERQKLSEKYEELIAEAKAELVARSGDGADINRLEFLSPTCASPRREREKQSLERRRTSRS